MHIPFIVNFDGLTVFHQLLVQSMQNGMTGAVG